MKVIEGFTLRTLGKDRFLVPESMGLVNFNKMIVLNPTAAFLWEKVGDCHEFTSQELVDDLLEAYEVEQDVAAKDVDTLLGQWKDAGLLEA